MKVLLISFVSLMAITTYGQEQKKEKTDTCKCKSKYLYAYMNELLDTERKINYIAIRPSFKSTVDRIQPLDTAEGAAGYVIEPYLEIKWPLAQKRVTNEDIDKKIIPLFGYSRLYMLYGVHSRFVKKSSSPIITPTGRFGFRFDKPFLMKQGGSKVNLFSVRKRDSELIPEWDPISMWFASVSWNHYSNGQSDYHFYINDSGDTLNRNNYFNGDFSTNFLKFMVGYKRVTRENFLLGATVGYSFDYGKADGFLSYIEGQNKRYGKERLSLVADLYVPKLGRRIPPLHFRFDSEYIITRDLSLYSYPNDLNRFGWHGFFEFDLLRSLGVMVHYYHGRDYLNIRYDDPVSTIQVGFTLELSRYTSARFDTPLQIFKTSKPE